MNELPPGELPFDKPAKAHCGWFAVSEEALRMIERTFDREGARRKAKACFITLLRIANLEGSIKLICLAPSGSVIGAQGRSRQGSNSARSRSRSRRRCCSMVRSARVGQNQKPQRQKEKGARRKNSGRLFR